MPGLRTSSSLHKSAISRLFRRKWHRQGEEKGATSVTCSPTVVLASTASDIGEGDIQTIGSKEHCERNCGDALAEVSSCVSGSSCESSDDPSESSSMEVDYYHNPTFLSRLILNQKYDEALLRLKNMPEEASVWVCAKRVPTGVEASDGAYVTRRFSLVTRDELGKNEASRRNSSCSTSMNPSFLYVIRQLPIHLACLNLRRTLDEPKKRLLNQLISRLIIEHPQGAGEFDHRGRLPLHDALCRDMRGNQLSEMNESGSGLHKDAVKELLGKNEEFWQRAQREVQRRRQGNAIEARKLEFLRSMGEREQHSTDDSGSIDSGEQKESPESGPSHLLPLTFERVLTDNEHEHSSSKHTTRDNGAVENVHDEMTARELLLLGEIETLRQRNAALNRKLSQIKNVLHDCDTADEEESLTQLSTHETSLFVGERINVEALLRFSSTLIVRHEALSTRHYDQKHAMTRMRAIVGTVENRQSSKIDEGNENASTSPSCALSVASTIS